MCIVITQKTITCSMADDLIFVADEFKSCLFASISMDRMVFLSGEFKTDSGVLSFIAVSVCTLVTLAPVSVPGLSTIEFCSHSVQMLA